MPRVTSKSTISNSNRSNKISLLPTDTAVSKLPTFHLNAEQSKAIGFGQRVKFANDQQLSGQVRLFSAENLFLGVALIDGNIIRPQRLITQSA